MIKRNAVTTYFWLIVAIASVLGSALLGSQMPNFLSHSHATAASLPLGIDWHYKLKEGVGDAEAGSQNIKITEGYIDAEIHCEPCTKVEYTPGPRGKAGIGYVLDGVLDFSGAKSVSFFMMGVDGDEKVKLKVAGKEDREKAITGRANERLNEARDKVADKLKEKLPSLELFTEQRFALTSEEVSLHTDWQKYTIDLAGADLSGITHPFAMEILKKKGAEEVVLYFKHIIYDTEPADFNVLSTVQGIAEASPLTLEIISNSTNGTAPATIEFTANATGGTAPYLLNWTFGDGGQADGENVLHTFEASGSYNVTLTAEDSLGQTASSSVMVQIEEAANPMTVGIEANSTEGSAPASIEFEANVENGSEPYEFEWNFGDDIEEGGDATVSHVFEDAGQYNVTVNVTDSEDQTGSSSIVVNITDIEEVAEESALNDTGGNETATSSEVPEETEESALPPEEPELPEIENTPPVARVIGDLLAYPGDSVILDASQSFDQEDEDEIQYQWIQSDGPGVEITSADSASPTIEIPSDLDQDEEIIMDVTVTDKNGTESEQESVRIFVDYIESLDSDDNLEEQELEPDGSEDSEWATECDDLIDCLTGGEQDTFVITGNSDEDEENTDLFSFEDFNIEENQEVQIKYVSIQVEATRSHETGYIRFVLDNDEEFVSDLVSILSDEAEEHRIIFEEDPRTGEEWTVESVNSLKAGYSYAGGQSEVRISEITAIVAYTVTTIDIIQEEIEAEITDDEVETQDQVDSPEETNNNNQTSASNNQTSASD